MPGKNKKEVCMIRSTFADKSSKLDKNWNVAKFINDDRIAFYTYSNLDLER